MSLLLAIRLDGLFEVFHNSMELIIMRLSVLWLSLQLSGLFLALQLLVIGRSIILMWKMLSFMDILMRQCTAGSLLVLLIQHILIMSVFCRSHYMVWNRILGVVPMFRHIYPTVGIYSFRHLLVCLQGWQSAGVSSIICGWHCTHSHFWCPASFHY